MSKLKIFLFLFWIFWLTIAAYQIPTQSILDTFLIVGFSGFIMLVAYWFYTYAYKLFCRILDALRR
ncbi:hypothetical protein D3C85_1293830 [compost metagenome]